MKTVRLLLIGFMIAFFVTCLLPAQARAAPLNSDADLTNIFQGAGQFTPSFSSSVTEYWVRMASTSTPFYTAATSSNSGAAMAYSMNGGSWVSMGYYVSTGYIATNRGDNTFVIRVTSTDSSTTKTYTIHIYYPPTDDADLYGLQVPGTIVSPAFQSSVSSYSASVPYTTSSITVTGVLSDSAASMKINDVNATSGSPSSSIPLNVGSNTITVSTKSSDSTATGTYTVTITRAAPSTNAKLSELTVSGGSLSPPFGSNQLTYTSADLPFASSQMTVTPTVEDSTATVKVRVNSGGYTAVSSGLPSSPLALNVGTNTIDVLVTAQDGTTTKTYTITVKRKKGDATLSGLSVTPGSVNEPFASGTVSYTMADVPNTTSTLTVTPTLTDAAGAFVRVRVNGGTYTPVTSGSGQSIPLAIGTNTIELEVWAEDTSVKKTYTITVKRQNGEAALIGLAVTPGNLNEPFASDRLSYTMPAVDYTTSTLVVTPVLANTTSAFVHIRVNGGAYMPSTSGNALSIPLTVGANTVDVEVLAEDASITKLYTVSVERLRNSDATLSALTFSEGAILFSPQVTDYSLTVSQSTYALTVKPTAAAGSAALIQVRVNGGSYTPVQSGLSSSSLPLVSGMQNVIELLITAQDGTNRLYTVRVNLSGTPVLQLIALDGMQARLTFSEPLLRAVTDATYYTITNMTRSTSLSVSQVVYSTGSGEVSLTFSGSLLPGDELQFRIKAGAVTSFIGAVNGEDTRTVMNGTVQQQLMQRLTELANDGGIHMNVIMTYMNSAYGRTDVTGDGLFDEKDIVAILRNIEPKAIR